MPNPDEIREMLKASIPSDEEMRANAERRLAREDKTCLSYWFPKIEAAGLPVPKTKIVSFTDYELAYERHALTALAYGQGHTTTAALEALLAKMPGVSS
jgi:hypothetical protein